MEPAQAGLLPGLSLLQRPSPSLKASKGRGAGAGPPGRFLEGEGWAGSARVIPDGSALASATPCSCRGKLLLSGMIDKNLFLQRQESKFSSCSPGTGGNLNRLSSLMLASAGWPDQQGGGRPLRTQTREAPFSPGRGPSGGLGPQCAGCGPPSLPCVTFRGRAGGMELRAGVGPPGPCPRRTVQQALPTMPYRQSGSPLSTAICFRGLGDPANSSLPRAEAQKVILAWGPGMGGRLLGAEPEAGSGATLQLLPFEWEEVTVQVGPRGPSHRRSSPSPPMPLTGRHQGQGGRSSPPGRTSRRGPDQLPRGTCV